MTLTGSGGEHGLESVPGASRPQPSTPETVAALLTSTKGRGGGLSVFVESVDVDAAWEVYYQLADRRHKDGLTLEELRQVIEAALVGKVEAKEERRQYRFPWHRFVSPWVEVEEHQ